MTRRSKPLRLLSLFSGCGGMDLGAEGGFRFLGSEYPKHPVKTVGALELDPKIAEIYRANFGSECFVEDIRKVHADDLPAHDILTGGFPCQSFSIVAQNPPRLGHDDDRGRLYFEMCRLLRHHRPAAFVAENVRGLLSANKGAAFPLILEEFAKCGYQVSWSLLNAADFGVPQKRLRVFIVGFRTVAASRRFTFPNPVTKESPPPLGLVLQGDDEVDETFYFSQRALNGLAKTRSGPITTKGRVQDPNQPCNTVGAHLAKVSLNSTDPVVQTSGRIRMFTPREVARIQSFPDSFQLAEKKTVTYRALGNAVPPVLMWHVMNSVVTAIRGTSTSQEVEA